MLLSSLLKNTGVPAELDKDVTGLTADSREVKPGFVFAALVGTQADGHKYIKSALENGAIAVLTDTGYAPEDCPVYVHQVENPRRELACLAARFYRQMPEKIVAVTGTNGKTSVAHFTRVIWQEMGLKSASLGTLGVVAKDHTDPMHFTTPEPVLLHRTLADIATKGVTHLALEASSHGLDQFRLDGAQVQVAGFTNLSRDHMDYHATSEEYLQAKLGLVSRVVADEGCVVLNADSDVYRIFRDAAEDRNLTIISYGRTGADLKLREVRSHGAGQEIDLEAFGEKITVDLAVAGEFQVMNILCALGMVVGAGGDIKRAIKALPSLGSVPGRMERIVSLQNGATVYVDFAHTPDALETVLNALRPHVKGQLHAVIGCGGDRDKGKRPMMGRIAERLADIVYVTDDNPRTEDPAIIRREILVACPDAIEIGDREAAIKAALEAADEGDVVLVAGKGHESGQIVGDTVIPFNDRLVIEALAAGMEAA